jgi:hypothetical protein
MSRKNETVTVKVSSYEEFRDGIHETRLFDMFDCNLEIIATPVGAVDEIDKIVTLIESMIHVHDIRITSEVTSEDYEVTIIPLQQPLSRRPKNN